MDIAVPRLITLGCLAALYAGLIYVWRDSKYTFSPDWTWVTVVIGFALIGLDLWWIEASGVTLTFQLIVVANIVAGVPMICEELIAWRVRHARVRAKKNGENHGTHQGGEGADR